MDWLAQILDIQHWSPATVVGLVQVAGELLAITHIPSVLLRRNNRPVAQLAWILCLVLLPFLGVLLWWRLSARRQLIFRCGFVSPFFLESSQVLADDGAFDTEESGGLDVIRNVGEGLDEGLDSEVGREVAGPAEDLRDDFHGFG